MCLADKDADRGGVGRLGEEQLQRLIIHELYDIHDVVSERLAGERGPLPARESLWAFGNLANKEPVSQFFNINRWPRGFGYPEIPSEERGSVKDVHGGLDGGPDHGHDHGLGAEISRPGEKRKRNDDQGSSSKRKRREGIDEGGALEGVKKQPEGFDKSTFTELVTREEQEDVVKAIRESESCS